MFPIPHEFAIGGIFMPPLMIASFLGILAAVVTAFVLNRFACPDIFLSTASSVFTGCYLYNCYWIACYWDVKLEEISVD